jgi:hypothetical protein
LALCAAVTAASTIPVASAVVREISEIDTCICSVPVATVCTSSLTRPALAEAAPA